MPKVGIKFLKVLNPIPLRSGTARPHLDFSKLIPTLVFLLSILAALALILAPKLPVWTEAHTPHINRPPLTLTSGQTLTQTFKFEYPTLDRIAIWLDPSQPLLTNSNLQLTVAAGDANRVLNISSNNISPDGLVVAQL